MTVSPTARFHSLQQQAQQQVAMMQKQTNQKIEEFRTQVL